MGNTFKESESLLISMIKVQSTNSKRCAITNRDIASDLLYTDTKKEAEVMSNGIIKAIPNALVFKG